MAGLLSRMHVSRGDKILVYDFNTSPSTLVLSGFFAPGLDKGACEKVGCVAICTDGLSELAARTAYVYTRWRPDHLMIRSELLAPFRAKLPSDNLVESNRELRSVVVVHTDVAPWPRKIHVGPGDFITRLLYRVDPASFMCSIEPCGGVYIPEGFYEADIGADGRLRVAANFAPNRPSVTTSLECVSNAKCGCGKTHGLRTEAFAV
jgi:hypothetical protein